jgi:hypothetical protein
MTFPVVEKLIETTSNYTVLAISEFKDQTATLLYNPITHRAVDLVILQENQVGIDLGPTYLDTELFRKVTQGSVSVQTLDNLKITIENHGSNPTSLL